MGSEDRENELLARIKELEAERDTLSARLKDSQQKYQSGLKSDTFLDSLISIIPDLFWLKSPDGKFLYCNTSFEDFSGLPRSELVGKTDYDIADKDLADFFRRKDLDAIAYGGPSKNEELLNFASDGKNHLIETIKTPLFDDDGHLLGVLGVGRDITELRDARTRLESFMDTASDAYIFFDSRGIAVDAGKSIAKILSEIKIYDKDELIQGKHFETLFSQFMTYEPFIRYRDFLNPYDPKHLESTFFHRETERWYRVQLFTMGAGFALIGSDTTELHLAKEKIVTNEDRWQSFLDSTMNIMGVVDNDSRLVSINKGVLQYLPQLHSTEELLGKKIQKLALYLNDGDKLIIGAYNKVTRTGQSVILEDSFVLKDKVIWLKCRLFKAGEGVGFIMEDITEMKTLENQILQMQKIESIGRLAGGIAHDFNNILGIIIGYVDLALASQESCEETERYLREIKKAGIKSSRMVSQLLAFARKQSIKPEVIDLNRTITGMLTMLSNLMKNKVTLSWEPGTPLRAIKVDPVQVDQILANLCVNARDAIEGTGNIHITTALVQIKAGDVSLSPEDRPGEYVRLSVKDDGVGMDEKTLSLIFEPFYTTKGVGKGTGLGLSTVYGIMKQNDGFIRVDSTPGKGTTVELYFPPLAE